MLLPAHRLLCILMLGPRRVVMRLPVLHGGGLAVLLVLPCSPDSRSSSLELCSGNKPPTLITEGERGQTEEGSQSKQRQDGEPPRDRMIHSLILSSKSDIEPRCTSNS